MTAVKIILFGASGRVGGSIAAQLELASVEYVKAHRDEDLRDAINIASVASREMLLLIFSIPHHAVKERLSELSECLDQVSSEIVILDCSGYVKQNFEDCFYVLGKTSWEQYLFSRRGQRVKYIGNPGCMASAVIQAVRASGQSIAGATLSVTCVGGKSYGPPAADDSQLRVARNWISHHHVTEIERFFREDNATVVSFIPLICAQLEHGLMVTISWQAPCTNTELTLQAETANAMSNVVRTNEELDVATILGTNNLALRVQTVPRTSGSEVIQSVSIAAAIDNVDYVANFVVVAVKQILLTCGKCITRGWA